MVKIRQIARPTVAITFSKASNYKLFHYDYCFSCQVGSFTYNNYKMSAYYLKLLVYMYIKISNKIVSYRL